MFQDSLIETSASTRTRRSLATLASFGVETVLLVALVLIPLLLTQAVPPVLGFGSGPVPPELENSVIVVPRSFPDAPYIPKEPETADAGDDVPLGPFVPGVPGGTGDPKAWGSGPIAEILKPAPLANVPKPAPVPSVIRVSRMSEGLLISRVEPRYPLLAIQTRTQGEVVLAALISRDGRIENLHLISGHPLLVPAAMDAVRQWRYRPTVLNGQPVEVETQIVVRFTLN